MSDFAVHPVAVLIIIGLAVLIPILVAIAED